MTAHPQALVILGSGGKLGHVTALHFLDVFSSPLHCLARRPTGIDAIDRRLTILDVRKTDGFSRWLKGLGPVTVINAIAGDPSRPNTSPEDLLFLNATFPRLLTEQLDAQRDGSRLIQISSDGVFKGDQGFYTEKTDPDATDAYGLGKIMGEILHPPHLSIRTSLIGHSLGPSDGLLDWFLSSQSPVKGYQRAFWNGVTSLELARFLAFALSNQITGLVHLAGEKCSKYELLIKIRQVYGKETPVIPCDVPALDRSLASVRTDFDYKVPTLDDMLRDYRTWYKDHVMQGA